MNDARRKLLNQAIDKIEGMKAAIEALKSQAEEAKELIETIRDDEQEAFDNLAESLQQGERGTRMEEVVGMLDTAIESVDDLADILEGFGADDIISSLDDAKA